uniref:F-box domain-containing protein n=1 Tax=Mycena chlorophos TaxID=658473 RepID=A0ABQ0L8L4_MYCCL|nr:predicted protein [Mycena chlorophos]
MATRMKLTTLTFSWDEVSPGADYKSAVVREEISQLASSLHNIRVLCLVNPAITGLARIARLRYLEVLTLKMYDPLVSSSNPGSPLLFAALRDLTLIVDDPRDQFLSEVYSPHKMDHAVDFLRNCNPLQLVSFELLGEHLITSSLNEMLAILAERVALPLWLHTITVALIQAIERIFDPDDGMSLRPLFRFGNLRVLRIELSWGVDLGDALLRDLAMAFPRLEILSLAYDVAYDDEDVRPCAYSTRVPPRPKTSLAGLAALVYWCRNLRELTITMDFDPPGTPGLPEWVLQGRARRPLKKFNTADSRIGNTPWLAVWFLAATFGQLDEVNTLHVREYPYATQYYPAHTYLKELHEYGAVWRKVNELLLPSKAMFSSGARVSIEQIEAALQDYREESSEEDHS